MLFEVIIIEFHQLTCLEKTTEKLQVLKKINSRFTLTETTLPDTRRG